VVLVLAYQQGECIAAALNLRSDDTLYGRHWGCRDQIPALHFETCYYQGLENSFEPGTQGEHKIARGFLPSATWSAHWIAHPEFRRAIEEFTLAEQIEIEKRMAALQQLSPFRSDVA
jgi:predicted N-acyltransferase